jgi:hypothetical protein
MPDFLSSEDPDRRTIEQLGKNADGPGSRITTASDAGSLLMSVRTAWSLAGLVAYAVMFLFPASIVLL